MCKTLDQSTNEPELLNSKKLWNVDTLNGKELSTHLITNIPIGFSAATLFVVATRFFFPFTQPYVLNFDLEMDHKTTYEECEARIYEEVSKPDSFLYFGRKLSPIHEATTLPSSQNGNTFFRVLINNSQCGYHQSFEDKLAYIEYFCDTNLSIAENLAWLFPNLINVWDFDEFVAKFKVESLGFDASTNHAFSDTIYPNTDINIVIPCTFTHLSTVPLAIQFELGIQFTLAFAICREADKPVLILFNRVDQGGENTSNKFTRVIDSKTTAYDSVLELSQENLHVVFAAYVCEKFVIKFPFKNASHIGGKVFRDGFNSKDLWSYRIIEKYLRIAHSLKTDASPALLDEYFPTIVDTFKNLISKPGLYAGLT
jgi:hypothetical protein